MASATPSRSGRASGRGTVAAMPPLDVAMTPDLRERAVLYGMDVLGDDELVALLLGTGLRGASVTELSSAVLAASGGLLGLARGGVPRALGIGAVKRARLGAALELGRRVRVRQALEARRDASTPELVVEWARAELGDRMHEELWVLALDAKNHVVAARRAATGGVSSCPVHVRDVLRVVLRAGAASFLVVHNHPTGDPTPSPEDVAATRALARAGEACGVPLVDHVVVGGARYTSLFAAGLLG